MSDSRAAPTEEKKNFQNVKIKDGKKESPILLAYGPLFRERFKKGRTERVQGRCVPSAGTAPEVSKGSRDSGAKHRARESPAHTLPSLPCEVSGSQV